MNVLGAVNGRFKVLVLVLALFLGLPAGYALAQKKLVVPIATWGSPNHINIVQFITPLKTALYRMTGERITVRHYPAGQIAQDVDMPISIPTGKVKLGWITISGWSGSVPDVNVTGAPEGLTMAQVARATDMDKGLKEVLNRKFEAKGAKLVAVTDLGPAAFVSHKKVVAPADFKGLKVRVFSEGGAVTMQQLGAAPVKMPFADVYTAMQRGTIDAAMIGFQGVASQRMYEVSKFVLVPASFFGMGLQGWGANKQWWDNLHPADREILTKAVREAELICRYEIIKDRAGLAEVYRGKGMTVTELNPTMPEYKQWVTAMKPLLKKAERELSPEILRPVHILQQEAKGS